METRVVVARKELGKWWPVTMWVIGVDSFGS